MTELLTFLAATLGLGGLGVAALFALLGSTGAFAALAEVLKTINLLLASILPILSQLLAGFLHGLHWVWEHIILKGLQDIVDSWATIGTVVLMGAILWGAIKFQYQARIEDRQAAINACYVELRKVKKAAVMPKQSPAPSFPNPWDLIFPR